MRLCFIILAVLAFSATLHATPADPHSVLPVYIRFNFSEDTAWTWLSNEVDIKTMSFSIDEEINDIAATIENTQLRKEDRRNLLHVLKVLKLKKAFRSNRYREKLYNNMAIISARLKLYPLAMQFCLKETENKFQQANDSATDDSAAVTINPEIEQELKNGGNEVEESEPVTPGEILQSFEDDKEAVNYAMMVHVKQPVAGKRKSFTGIDNVGHMFITLIKYNADNTYVSRTFGFYPLKTSFLSATPFKPTTAPVFKDDALHDWDEAFGKFISYRRFTKIIKLICRYDGRMYNLNENNCTDFGMAVASLSGIEIKETKGKWPFGKGNNPANAGQSILENKIVDIDRESDNLFMFKK